MTKNVFTDKGRITFGGQTAESDGQADKTPTKEQREQALMETTLDNIGIPDDLDRVDVRQLQDWNHYRVNVYRWKRGESRIVDSFYIVMTPDGVMSSPPMEKRYYTFDELDELVLQSQSR